MPSLALADHLAAEHELLEGVVDRAVAVRHVALELRPRQRQGGGQRRQDGRFDGIPNRRLGGEEDLPSLRWGRVLLQKAG